MTLVNVDTHVDPDPKTRISEAENFMGRSTPSPAACVGDIGKSINLCKYSCTIREQ